jgi:hypothetical protein
VLGDDAFPEYLRTFIGRMSKSLENDVLIQKSSSVYPGMSPDEKASISRKKGMIGASQIGSGDRQHFLKIFTNDHGKGRLYYKFNGSIQFLKNLK